MHVVKGRGRGAGGNVREKGRSGDSGQVFVCYLMHINEVVHVIIDGSDGAVRLVLQRAVRTRFKTSTDE